MKQESIVIDKKTLLDLKTALERMTVAGTVYIIGAAFAISIFLSLFWIHALSPFTQMVVFLLAGIIHVFSIRKELNFVSVGGKWMYTLFVTGIILIVLCGIMLWKSNYPFTLVIGSAAAFLLPFALNEIWIAYLQLALDGVKVWHPTTEKEIAYPSFYFNSSLIHFRILQGNGLPRLSLQFKASNELSLGKIYFDLVQNKTNINETIIPLSNALQKPYFWVFFTTDNFILMRSLDPEKTLAKNGLKENQVIYAQRVSSFDISILNEKS
ncbi:hypothetical protein HRH25_18790 [Flavisolibacter sp. BT320]|nr:hypothetical protein [Flavisolibacter longurius]